MMADEFNIEKIKIAETYNPNDPFSPLPPAPKRTKLYENFDDILIRTSREEYLQKKAQRQRERKRQKERERRQRQSWSYMLHNKGPESNKKLDDNQDQKIKKEETKELSGIAEMKKIMKELYCQPASRPSTNNNRPKKIIKKPEIPICKTEIDIFDFTPISTRKNNKTTSNKDVKPIKQEPGTDEKINFELAKEVLSESNKSGISNEYNATNSIDMSEIKVKIEFEDNFIKEEPYSEDYDNQPAVSYDESTDTIVNHNGEIEKQNTLPKCRIVENFDYNSLLEAEEDDYGDINSHTYYTEVESFIKEEIPDEWF